MKDFSYKTIKKINKRIDLAEIDGRIAIIKYQRLESGKLTQQTEDEIKHEYDIQQQLTTPEHPHICKSIGLLEREVEIGTLHAIAMEWLGEETLEEHMNGGYKTANERIRVLLGIAKALKHAHDNNIVYCDLRPENIMIVDGRGVLIDWDGARKLDYNGPLKETVYRTLAITEDTVAPELLKQGILTPQNDVFSLGVTSFLALNGRNPFEYVDGGKTIDHDAQIATALTLRELHFGKRLSETMFASLEKFYNNRPTMQELIKALEDETEEQSRSFKIKLQ